MAQYTKANGSTTRPTARALSGMQKEIFIQGNSKQTKQMASEFTLMSMDLGTKETGSTTCKKDKEKRHGLTAQSMLVNIEME